MSENKCTNTPYTQQESKDNMATIMNLMGDRLSQTCQTAYAEGKMDSFIVDAQVNAGASSGCGPISMMSNAYTEMSKTTTCTINSLKNSVTTKIVAVNSIVINLDNSILDGEIDLKQLISGKINIIASMSEQVKNQITNDIKSTIKQLQNNLQSQTQTAGAVVPGATSVQDVTTELQTFMDSSSINETVNTLATDLMFQNTNIINIRNSTVKKDIKIDQNIVIDIAISNMVSTVIDNIIKNTKIVDLIQVQTNEQDSKSLSGLQKGGMGLGFIINIIILIVLLYYFCKSPVIYLFLILYLFCISLIFFLLWYYSDNKNIITTVGGPISASGFNPKTIILFFCIFIWIICGVIFVFTTYQKIFGCRKINTISQQLTQPQPQSQPQPQPQTTNNSE